MSSEKQRPRYPAKAHLAAAVKWLPNKRKSDYILLVGSKLLPIGTSDQSYDFVQESFFYYCSGVSFPDALLLYDIAKAHLTIMIQGPRTGKDVVYLGQRPSLKDTRQLTDADTVCYTDATLPKTLELVTGIFYTLADADLVFALTRARAVKDDYELNLLQIAAEVSDEAHRGVARYVQHAETEQSLDAIFRTLCATARRPVGAGAFGGLRYSYTPIVAAGVHASILHYAPPAGIDSPLDGDLVLIDAAASVSYYASDVTRTYPRNGKFTPLARQLYALVLKMQEESISMLRPGVKMSEASHRSHQILAEAMVKNKWLKDCSPADAEAYGLTQALLPHGIGHHVGLDVHDVTPVNLEGTSHTAQTSKYAHSWAPPVTSSSYKISQQQLATHEAPLEAGNVVTIEPGVYFNREYLQTFYDQEEASKYLNEAALAAWIPLGGARIEDVVLITEDGHKVLSHAPKTIDDIEALCSS